MDIAPGLLRSRNPVDASCYWERLEGFSGESVDRLANDVGPGPAVVDVKATDIGFTSKHCATWERVAGGITTSLTASFGPGTYMIGTDVASGTW
jgi:hypothetical protein